ncbi:Heavy-metal-associated domain protein [compost metagenome]
MTCGGCAKSVTNALRSVDPDAHIETDPTTRKVSVTSTVDERDFLAVLEEAGYPHQK